MRWTSEIRITTPGVSEAPHCPLCAALSSLLHNTDSWARRDIAAGEELLEDYGVRAAHLSRFGLRSCSLADLQSVTARSTTVSTLPPLVCASSFLANLKCILSEVQWFEDLAKEYDVMSCVECAEKY